MAHRIVVLGGGYAGIPAACRLGNQLRGEEVEVTLVNASAQFVERPRLHQLATGQRLRSLPLRRFLDTAGVDLVVGAACAIDLDAREVAIRGADGSHVLAFDTLVYALGSTIDTTAVAGIAEHAYSFTGPDSARRLHARVEQVARAGGRFVVCGGGLTGIEAAAELAERYPSLAVTLMSPQPPGHWLSPRAQRYLAGAFERLGVQVRTGLRATEVREDAVVLAGGRTLRFEGCVWAGGFTVPALAREAGLTVDPRGRVVVDDTLRSVSHPDVYAIGDAAAVRGPGDRCLAMGCRSGGFTGPQVADIIADRLAARSTRPFRFRYVHECISLGRADGLIQFLHADETPRPMILTGGLAVRYKELVLTSAGWLFRRPGPHLRRRRHIHPSTTRITGPDPVRTDRSTPRS